MAAYKVVHAVCLALCEPQIMDTRHITLNEWQLLPEDRVLAVASRVGLCYQHPCAKGRGWQIYRQDAYCAEACDCAPQDL